MSGWGNVSKGDWLSHATIPDLLSAVTAAPEVKVDYWRTRIATADKSMLKHLPKSFSSIGKEVRVTGTVTSGLCSRIANLLPCSTCTLTAACIFKGRYPLLCIR